ncbi:MAG TPA: DNA recombination protein RmuC, partial [Burkholderiales bacterium]|nr:DNA recombination protein RmuC [Burkholderiales bacterium]
MTEQLFSSLLLLAAVGGFALWVALRLAALERRASEQTAQLAQALEEKHRAMLKDLHDGLTRQGDRLGEALGRSSGELRAAVEGRLDQISGRVAERLDEGFRRTSETFTSVMARLAAIDEAQKKLDGLTSNVVTLQELLGDKRSRGAFGEVQLEALVRNILPPQAWAMQYTLPNGARADCVLRLPEPTGMVAVDSKFPLENY